MTKDKQNKSVNVPALRFPEFSGEWESCKLRSIGYAYNGLSGKSGSDFGTGAPFITYKSVFDNSKIDIRRTGLVKITEQERLKHSQNTVRRGDAFFTISSETPEEVGMSSVLLDDIDDCYLNSFCFGYRPTSTSVTPGYLRHYLRSPRIRKKIIILAQGSTRFNISKDEVINLTVALPSLDEQNKIARTLDLIEERIETQSKIIEEQETLLKSLADKLISSQVANVALNDCVVAKASTMKESEMEPLGAVPVYGASGLCGYSNEALEKSDSILVTKDGSGVGTCQYATGDHSFLGTLCSLTAKKDVYLPYIYYALLNFNFAAYKTGLAIPHIYFKDYGKANIFCPSYDEQIRIASGLERLEAKINTDRELLKQFHLQKGYLLSRMFI